MAQGIILAALALFSLSDREVVYPPGREACWQNGSKELRLIRTRHGDPFGLSGEIILAPGMKICFPGRK